MDRAPHSGSCWNLFGEVEGVDEEADAVGSSMGACDASVHGLRLGSPVRMLRPSPERWGCAPPPGTGLVRADGGEVRASLQLGRGWQL